MGKHSVPALTPAGKFAGSVAPSRKRHPANWNGVRAKKCSIVDSDHPVTKIENERLEPSQSTSRPLTRYITV